MFRNKIKKFFPFLVVVIYALLIALMPDISYQGDVVEWIRWAEIIFKHGITRVYEYDVNYPPVFIYLLGVYAKGCSGLVDIVDNIMLIKCLVLVFDLLPLIVIFYLTKLPFKWWYILLLLNPAFLHNTLIWGQMDAIPSFFVSTSFLLFKTYPFTSIVLFAFGLCSKTQAIIFLPLFIILWIFYAYSQNVKTVIKYSFVLSFSILIIFFPFIIEGQIFNYLNTFRNQVGLYTSTSLNAFNIWFLFFNENPFFVKDTEVFWGIAYRYWGLMMFCFFSLISLVPTLYLIRNSKCVNLQCSALFSLLVGIITLLFFYFNTEMHERYSHPAMLAFFYYGVITNRFFPFVISCVLYFMNIEAVFPFFGFKNWFLIAGEEGISVLFGFFIIYLLYELYSKFYLPFISVKSLKFKISR